MSKFNVASKYVAATPRSQRRKGAGVSSAPSSGVAGSGIDKNTLAQYVDLISPQDVEGLKNFLNGLLVAGKLIRYDADKDALVIPMNLIVEKEAAWNSSPDGFDVPTFMDAVRVDNITIKKENGVLTVIGGAGGSGGGVADSVLWSGIIGKPTTIEGYGITDAYTIAEITEILSAYATQSWVTGRGYITGINSSMVIAALGYTPYNAANFTKANIKSTLGISDWALASVKPSYSWNEIGSRPTALSQFSNDSGFITNNVTGNLSVSKVLGVGRAYSAEELTSYYNADFKLAVNGGAYIKRFLQADEQIAAQYYYSNIAKATGANTSGCFRWGAFDEVGGLKLQFGADSNCKFEILNRAWKLGLFSVDTAGNVTASGSLTVAASVTAPTFIGSLSGVADNSTQLNGLGADYYVKSPSSYDFASFNSGLGRNAIYEYRAGDGISYGGDPVGSGYGVLMNIRDYRGNDGFQFLSTAASAWNKTDYRLLYRGKARSTSMDMSNGWSEIPLMDMSGNLVIKGEVSWHSSRVLKNIVNDEPTYLSMADMLKIKPYRYTWKDGRDDKVHAGGIADEVLEVLPEVIITDSEGIHSMDYGQASFTVATSLVPHVNRHEEEIDALKRRVKELEDLVTKLLNKYGDL